MKLASTFDEITNNFGINSNGFFEPTMEILRMVSFVVLYLLISIAYAKNMGPIKIEGVEEIIYVIAPDWSEEFVTMHDDGFTLNGGGRVYFAKYPVDDFSDPFAFWQTPLIGNNLSYEIGKMFLALYNNI